MRKAIRAVGIVIRDEKVLLIHRKNTKEYYVFPGGGVEEGETVEEAVVRELKEEASVEVVVKKLLYHHHLLEETGGSDQYFYLCEYKSGELKLGEANELEDMRAGGQYYEPVWIEVSKMLNLLIYPLEIRDWLSNDWKNSFGDIPREETIKVVDLRQDL